MEQKIIRLSFDDKTIQPKRFGERTIVNMVSYFRTDRLNKYFSDCGFNKIPDSVIETFNKCGYVYDAKLNGYATKTTGVAVLSDDDKDNQIKANHIAMTKAKYKAYDRANRCIHIISNNFFKAFMVMKETELYTTYLTTEELGAVGRVVETGYCNKNIK